jgi:DNA polymerase-4
MDGRFIIHLNVADFAVAVERLTDLRLRKRPVIIAPHGALRAAVYDMSEEAYQNGVRKRMALGTALRRCRDARVVAPHIHRYENATRELFRCVRPYSPLIEMTDYNGHLFMDVTETGKLFGPAPDIARRIRMEVRRRMGVDPIWSVAPNKLTAKVATRLVKPTGDYIVDSGNEAPFLHPVALYLIPGIDADDLKTFHALNLTRAGQVAPWSADQLDVVFGKRSPFLYDAVRGIDAVPVTPVGQRSPAIRKDHEFADDTNDPEIVNGALYRLVEQSGWDLRRRQLAARRAGIVLGYSDGIRIIRQATAGRATATDVDLFKTAETALARSWTRRVRIRHIRLICDRLTRPSAQLSLFTDPKETNRRNLMTAMDDVRRRFGPSALKTGRTLLISQP